MPDSDAGEAEAEGERVAGSGTAAGAIVAVRTTPSTSDGVPQLPPVRLPLNGRRSRWRGSCSQNQTSPVVSEARRSEMDSRHCPRAWH